MPESLWGALKTGDLVLFAPPDLAGGLLGRLGRRSWKRVVMVVHDPEHGEPMVWESAPAAASTRGRLRRLAKRLGQHVGRISVRRLNQALTPAQCDQLAAWRRAVAEGPVRRSLIDLIGDGDDGWLGRDHASLGAPLLPAELVAEGYQRIGLLDPPAKGGRPARRYTVRDFSEHEALDLKQDYALGAEIPLRTGDRASAGERLGVQTA